VHSKKIVFLFKRKKRFAFDFLGVENARHFPSLAFTLRERVISSEVFGLQSKESELCLS
jgi:hypothetical protein